VAWGRVHTREGVQGTNVTRGPAAPRCMALRLSLPEQWAHVSRYATLYRKKVEKSIRYPKFADSLTYYYTPREFIRYPNVSRFFVNTTLCQNLNSTHNPHTCHNRVYIEYIYMNIYIYIYIVPTCRMSLRRDSVPT